MLNIVVPMAGAGSRFKQEGYTDPKPLIPVHGVPMIKVVIDNLTPNQEHRFIFICQKEHAFKYDLENKLNIWAPHCEIVLLNSLTEGAACTVLTAKHLFNNNDPLMIANSDQYINIDIDRYLEAHSSSDRLDGLIMTMPADDPKWSFVELDHDERVIRVVEKEVISNHATVGIYNFTKGSDFIDAAESMIEKNLRTNNEFYVAPAYNELINNGKTVGIFSVGEHGMYGLGTPQDLNMFLALSNAQQGRVFHENN